MSRESTSQYQLSTQHFRFQHGKDKTGEKFRAKENWRRNSLQNADVPFTSRLEIYCIGGIIHDQIIYLTLPLKALFPHECIFKLQSHVETKNIFMALFFSG